jgi:hypothetical protein
LKRKHIKYLEFKQSNLDRKNRGHGLGYKVDQYSKDNIFLRSWNNASEASRFLNISSSGITSCVNGKLNHFHNFIWKRTLVERHEQNTV